MKKLILPIAMSLILGTGYAQESVGLAPIKKGAEPKAVLNALKEEFPQATASEFNFISRELYGQKWSETEDGSQLNGSLKYLQVTVKDKNNDYQQVIFDEHGKVINVKEFIKHADLPAEITKALKAKYPECKLLKDSERISTGKANKATAIYRLEIQTGPKGEKRNLFYDNGGKLLRDAHVIIA
ncbi:MAG TPA: hypothetical protein VFW11_21935 [Cyclobacteriaceae bacterium]|nr:hypothetical protein [Cyclobacteriaceae bacterium]